MNDCNQPAFFLSLEEMQYQLFCLSSELKKNFFESKLDFLATFFFSIFLLLAMLEWQFLRLFSKPNILSTFFNICKIHLRENYILMDFNPKYILGETFYFAEVLVKFLYF